MFCPWVDKALVALQICTHYPSRMLYKVDRSNTVMALRHLACFKIRLHVLPRRKAHREGHCEEAKQEWGKEVQVQDRAHDRATSPTQGHEDRGVCHHAVHHVRGHNP